MRQSTIRREEHFTGIALHGGGEVSVRLLPAAADSGIVFRRTDLEGSVRAAGEAVVCTRLATTLQQGAVRVGMVEHVLSALSAAQVDNIVIELDGGEVPILDGSAAPWLLFLAACGREEQVARRRSMRVRRAVRVEAEDGCFAELSPAAESSYEITIDYPHEVVNRSGVHCAFTLTKQGYKEQIARARTFCYEKDVEHMHGCNLAQGGSLQNAVVYNDKQVINEHGLRYPDEFVRHKMLDSIGDCYINGVTVLGHYRAHKPGHGINNRLMRALQQDGSAWEWHTA